MVASVHWETPQYLVDVGFSCCVDILGEFHSSKSHSVLGSEALGRLTMLPGKCDQLYYFYHVCLSFPWTSGTITVDDVQPKDIAGILDTHVDLNRVPRTLL